MSKRLKQVINLSKKTGDRIIVFDNNNPEDSFVLMTLNQYEDLIDKDLFLNKYNKKEGEKEEEKEGVKKGDEKEEKEEKEELEKEAKEEEEELEELEKEVKEEIKEGVEEYENGIVVENKREEVEKNIFNNKNNSLYNNSDNGIDSNIKKELEWGSDLSDKSDRLKNFSNKDDFNRDSYSKNDISDGPLKETLRNLLTEKKIVDKIDSIEKNNTNLRNNNGFRGNDWKIPPDVKNDSE